MDEDCLDELSYRDLLDEAKALEADLVSWQNEIDNIQQTIDTANQSIVHWGMETAKNDFVMNGPPNSKRFWPYGLLRQMGEKAIYYYHLIISIGFFITSLFILVSIINQFIVILQNNV